MSPRFPLTLSARPTSINNPSSRHNRNKRDIQSFQPGAVGLQQNHLDDPSDNIHPELASRPNAFADSILQRRADIYNSLKTLEAELSSESAPDYTSPCEVRRFLPADIVRMLLLALPAADFIIRKNSRNINRKVEKIAKTWDVERI
ncbi:hypothetical protein ColTof4_14031 [Colletotrichum tofieldiae]|nr:hypothetical protein ColTof3_14667 [Colletotrichum tofieldiae]GKT81608.1 hypothetical protein ColTof4_14031 [Colletotrichum tofieldiae]GKT97583.1 hypothetical protein Ct61P_15433 [Colletotrichum tofieldiae]